MTKVRILTAVALIALVGGLVHQRGRVRALQEEVFALKAAASAGKAEPVPSAAPSAMETERVQRERAELMRLRAEVTTLKQRLRALQPAPSQQASAPEAAPEAAPDAPPQFRKFSSSLTSVVPNGGTMISGGWQTEAGKRTFVFLTPTVLEQAQDSGVTDRQVLVQGKIIEMPEAFMQSAAMATFAHDPRSDTYSGSMTPEQMETLWEQARETEGVNVLSAPKLIANDSREAQISITDIVTRPDGEQVPLGPQIHMVPRITENGTIEMTVNANLTMRPLGQE